MTGTLIFILYGMVADGFSKKHGFWKGWCWPYFVGCMIGDAIERRAALEGSEG